MNMLKQCFFRFLFSLLFIAVLDQSVCTQPLQAWIEEAKKSSLTALDAQLQFQASELNFQLYKYSIKPSLFLSGNAPVYNEDSYGVQQPDGSIKFLRRSQNMSNVGLSFSQPVAFTGGMVALSTTVFRYDDFIKKDKQYNGTPIFISVDQPLLAYNPYKWAKRIEPLKQREAHLNYELQTNSIAFNICKLYFDVLLNQLNEQLAQSNLLQIDRNLTIQKRKFELGLIREEEYLQGQIDRVKAGLYIKSLHLNTVQSWSTLLKQVQNNQIDTVLHTLTIPEPVIAAIPTREQIMGSALENSSTLFSLQRQKVELASQIEQSKLKARQINLTASFGLNKAAAKISSIYYAPNQQQRFSIGFNVPVYDWGKQAKVMEQLQVQYKALENETAMQKADLKVEILGLYDKMMNAFKNISDLKLLDTLSQRKYEIDSHLYQDGKISLLEWQNAQNEKDVSRLNYISVVRDFWESYYMLQVKTNATFN